MPGSAALTQPFDLRKYSQAYVGSLGRASGALPGMPAKPLTESQEQLLPYLHEEVQKEATRRGLLQPVEMLFDVLQRGQYLTANIAEQVVRNLRGGEPLLQGMPDAVKNALSGKVKGDWEVVLFGGKSPGGEQFEGIRPWQPTTRIGKAGRKVAGFVANVAADPLTYVGVGPATAARSAATKYSDDAVRVLINRLGRNADDLFPGLVQRGIDWNTFAKKFADNTVEGMAYLEKYAGEDLTKLYSKIKKEAYNYALRNPASKVTRESLDDLVDNVVSRYHVGTEDIPGAMGKMQPPAQKALGTTYGEPINRQLGVDALPTELRARQPRVMFDTEWAKRGITERQFPDVVFDPEGLTKNVLPGSDAEKITKLLTQAPGNPYAGAGQRAMRIFRKEFAAGERYPGWLQKLDTMKQQFNESKIGGLFSDAWWSFLNNEKSPVAALRRMFHVRNPYQKMVSIMERDVLSDASYEMVNKGEQILYLVDELSDEERKAVTGAMVHSQVYQEVAKKQAKKAEALRMGEGNMFRGTTGEAEEMARMAAGEWAQEPVTMSAADIINKFAPGDPNEAAKLTKIVDEINAMTNKWQDYMQWAKENGFCNDIGDWEDYLPIQPRSKTNWKKAGKSIGTAPPAYGRERKLGFSGHLKQQAEKIKFLFGVDEETAADLITSGGSNLNVDLQDMLLRRAFAQTRFEQRVNLIQQFREFGIDLSDIQKANPDLYNAMAGKWGEVDVLGLKPIKNVMGLDGYVFDTEVAEVLTRAVEATDSDKSMRSIVNAVSGFTSWWRGWATLSPGFHARNYLSNNVTGFLKHGVEWFDPKVHMEAFVATAIGLHGYDDGIKRLSQILPKDTVLEIANRRIGDRTLAELAQMGGSRGIVSRMTRGFQKPNTYEEFLKSEGKMFENLSLNPFSTAFTPMTWSRNIGSYVESEARFASFLFDYKRTLKQGGAEEAAFEYAKQEAKKWFIDYSDLSKFERNVMRNVAPFYTWLRGNVANQISGLMQFTEMYTMIPKAQKAATMEGGPGQGEMPDWMRELGLFPISEGQDATRFFWPNFPYMDINQLPMKFRFTEQGIPVPVAEDPVDALSDIMTDAHPVLKTIIQTVGGIDLFYKERLEEPRPAPRALRILTKSPEILQFLDGVLRGVGFKNGLRADVDNKGRLVIDPKIGKILEDNILPLRMIPQYLDLPELIMPVIEDWKMRAFGAKDDYEGLEEFFQTLSFYGGIKLKEMEVEENKFWENEELMRRAQDELSKDKRKLPGAAQQRQDWMNKRMATQRKLGL